MAMTEGKVEGTVVDGFGWWRGGGGSGGKGLFD